MQSDNYTQRAEGRRPDASPAEDQLSAGTRAFRSAGRSRRIGCGSSSTCVLPGQRERRPGHVLQQERRRPHQVDLRAGLQPAGRATATAGHDQADPAPDLPGLAARQAELFWDEQFRFNDSLADRRHHRSDGGRARDRYGRNRMDGNAAAASRSSGRRRRRTSCCSRRASAPTCRTGTGASGRATIAT